jgi:hypothetical protein
VELSLLLSSGLPAACFLVDAAISIPSRRNAERGRNKAFNRLEKASESVNILVEGF